MNRKREAVMKSKAWLAMAGLMALFLAGFLSGVFSYRYWSRPWIEQRDTVINVKTAEMDTAPVIISSYEAPCSAPAVSIPSSRIRKDTSDTSAVSVIPDVVTITGALSGGLTYQATMTGIQPSLQHLTVNYPEYTITQNSYKPYKGWMLSAVSDVSVFGSPAISLAGRVALETSYNAGPFHFGFQGGIVAFPESGAWQYAPFIGARLTFDIIKFK